VVNSDVINRRGIASLLCECPGLTVVAAVSHTCALQQLTWDNVDVALIGAADERRLDDQFPGVGVAQHIRRIRSSLQTSIVVITEHYFDDALRRRTHETSADSFHYRRQMADTRALRDLVLHARETPCGVPPVLYAEALFCLGVTESTRVNRAVAFALEHDLQTQLAARAQPRSRYWLRLRAEFNHHARLNPVTADGLPPDRDQHLPSLLQIARFLTWATKVKTPHPPADERPSTGTLCPVPEALGQRPCAALSTERAAYGASSRG
jgi:CheY-like chemotaxis protein